MSGLIRHRRVEDLPQCVALLESVFQQNAYPARWPTDPAGWIANTTEQEAWVLEETQGLVVGHIDRRVAIDHPVTTLWCEKSGRSQEELAVISRLFVDPKHHGKGFGSKLLTTAVKKTHELGLLPVLDVLADQSRLIDFYTRRGWRVVGEADDTWISVDDPIRVVALIGPPAPTA